MEGNRSPYATEQEVQQLREEMRQLKDQKDQKESHNGDGGGKPERDEGKKAKDEPEGEQESKPHPVRNILLLAGFAVAAVVGIFWWLHARHYEHTDDAQIEGHIGSIASRIQGTVTAVYVEENQFVKAGQLVADLDPSDLKVQLALARSKAVQAEAQARAEQPNVPVTVVTNQTNIAAANADLTSAEAGVAAAERDHQALLAKVREAEANAAKAAMDVERYRPLAAKDEVPQQQFDQVQAVAKAMEAALASSLASAEAAAKQVVQKKAQLAQAREKLAETQKNAPLQVAIRQANVAARQSSLQAAREQVNEASLNLSYTRLTSPVDGIVAKRTAEVGQHLSPGQPLFQIVQLTDLWVTANFRETQVRRMNPGQSVQVHVDALNLDLEGYVESMPAASGAVTSLLPPENATGNYVKVVQRLPTRIRFKKDQVGLDRLRPGMSVVPNVRLD